MRPVGFVGYITISGGKAAIEDLSLHPGQSRPQSQRQPDATSPLISSLNASTPDRMAQTHSTPFNPVDGRYTFSIRIQSLETSGTVILSDELVVGSDTDGTIYDGSYAIIDDLVDFLIAIDLPGNSNHVFAHIGDPGDDLLALFAIPVDQIFNFTGQFHSPILGDVELTVQRIPDA